MDVDHDRERFFRLDILCEHVNMQAVLFAHNFRQDVVELRTARSLLGAVQGLGPWISGNRILGGEGQSY